MSIKDNLWSDYEYVSNSFMEKEKVISVEKGDKVEFIINDHRMA